MPRQPRRVNRIKTEPVTLRTTAQTCSDLDVLLASGRFGKTRAETAEQLLREKIRDLVLEGWLGPGAVASPQRSRSGQTTPTAPQRSKRKGRKP